MGFRKHCSVSFGGPPGLVLVMQGHVTRLVEFPLSHRGCSSTSGTPDSATKDRDLPVDIAMA